MEHAWVLSEYAPDLLDVYVEIQRLTGNFEAIRQAYKRLGIQLARQADVAAALDFFNRWLHVDAAAAGNAAQAAPDPDILAAIRHMADAYSFRPPPAPLLPDEKLRVAYLMLGTKDFDSINTRLSQALARGHDRSAIQAAFFVAEPLGQVEASPQGLQSLKSIVSLGCRVDVAPDAPDELRSLLILAKAIHDFQPHLLVLNAAQADFKSLFIAALRPAPMAAAMHQGWAGQLIPPTVDAVFSTGSTSMIDTPADCSRIPLEIDLPDARSIQAMARQEASLPEGAVVLCASGRQLHHRPHEFWQLVAQILADHPTAWFLAIGIRAEDLPPVAALSDAAVRSRIRFTDENDGERRAVTMADIVLDTYPCGNGIALLEAMALGKPVVGFDDGLLAPFDAAEHTSALGELLIPRGETQRLLQVVGKLVHEPEYRRAMGSAGQRHVQQHHGNPERMVRRYEAGYRALLKERHPDPQAAHTFEKERRSAVKFSIIMPTYNHEKYLPAALDSVLAQTHANWELVAVNDGATDNTAAILDSYAARDARIRPIHKCNGGTVSALNEALRHVTGDWVCWLSSDDWFEPGKLAVHAEEICNHPGIHFFHTNHYLADESSGQRYRAPFDVLSTIPPESLQVIRLFHLNYVNGISVCIDRSLFHELGHFNARYRAGHDFEMWLRISAHYRSCFIDRPMSTTRLHPQQDTQRSTLTGIIDSGVACLDFLNTHTFNELFPSLDLGDAHQAIAALREALHLLLDKQGYINICGFEQPLIDRLAEWSCRIAGDPIRKVCIEEVEHLAALNSRNPEAMVMLHRIRRRIAEVTAHATYTPHDPIILLKDRITALQVSDDRAQAPHFLEYIQRVEKSRESAQVPVISPALQVANTPATTPALRILFVLHNFLPRNHGGVETYTYRQARELQQLGHHVTVAYPVAAGETDPPELIASTLDAIPVRVMRYFSRGSLDEQITHAGAEGLFRSLLAGQRYDIVHFQHFLGVPLSLMAIAKETGAKIVATLHDFHAICFRYHLFVPGQSRPCSGPETPEKCARCLNFTGQEPGLLEGIGARLRDMPHFIDEYADLVSAPSGYVSDTLSRWGFAPHKLQTIPLGVELVGVPSRHREPTAEISFGFAGNIVDVKNFSLLVQAFQLVRGDAHLHFFGGGDEHNVQRLLNMIQGDARITYHGRYAPQDLAEIFSAIDVLVQPSVVESFGLAVREAMSAGVPVIAARAGALPEALTHLRDGILFDPGSVENLAYWLQQLIDHPEMRRVLRQNIRAPLSIKEDAAAWLTRYTALLQQGRDVDHAHLLRYQEAERQLKDGRHEDGERLLLALVVDKSPLWMPYNDIGVLLYEQGNREDAKEMLLQAASRESPPGIAHLNLARVEADLGNFATVLEILRPLLSSPDTAEMARKLAEEIVAAQASTDRDSHASQVPQ